MPDAVRTAREPASGPPRPEQDRFEPPPVIHNARGQVRKAGFELEFAGVSFNVAAMHVRKVFGGEHVIRSTFVHAVRVTPIGEFSVEMDTTVLKDKTYEKPLRAMGFEPHRHDARWIEAALLGAFSTLVPAEVATPPLPVTHLAPLDDLRRRCATAAPRAPARACCTLSGFTSTPRSSRTTPPVCCRSCGRSSCYTRGSSSGRRSTCRGGSAPTLTRFQQPTRGSSSRPTTPRHASG